MTTHCSFGSEMYCSTPIAEGMLRPFSANRFWAVDRGVVLEELHRLLRRALGDGVPGDAADGAGAAVLVGEAVRERDQDQIVGGDALSVRRVVGLLRIDQLPAR